MYLIGVVYQKEGRLAWVPAIVYFVDIKSAHKAPIHGPKLT